MDIDKNNQMNQEDVNLVVEEEKKEDKAVIKKSDIMIFAKEIIIAFLIAIVIMQFFKPTIIKETSMEPTLYENDYVILSKQAYRYSNLNRGDIIVFESELKQDNGKNKLLIKRIIGLPGDVVTIVDGNVYLNDLEIREAYIKDGYTSGWVENLQVPPDSVFVMGDNREVSVDSRCDCVGFVKINTIVGKAVVRLYPFNKITMLNSVKF